LAKSRLKTPRAWKGKSLKKHSRLSGY